MIGLDRLSPLLRCPDCRSGILRVFLEAADIQCENCAAWYPVVLGRPVLLRHDNAVFRIDDYRRTDSPRARSVTQGIARLVPTPSVNLASERMLGRVRDWIMQWPE